MSMIKHLTLGHKKLYEAFCGAQYNGKLYKMDMAKRIGISPMMLSYLFSGERRLRNKKVRATVQRLYNIPASDWDVAL